jgi:hypothetical protein
MAGAVDDDVRCELVLDLGFRMDKTVSNSACMVTSSATFNAADTNILPGH